MAVMRDFLFQVCNAAGFAAIAAAYRVGAPDEARLLRRQGPPTRKPIAISRLMRRTSCSQKCIWLFRHSLHRVRRHLGCGISQLTFASGLLFCGRLI
jgi:hypothetical protein